MTERITMTNVKEKLSKCREICVGMSEEIYALTEFMSTMVEDIVKPEELALTLFSVKEEIRDQRNGLTPSGIAVSPYLRENKKRILNQIMYFPQVIDAIAEPEFAESFRRICKNAYGYNPPRRVYVELDKKYPEYIKVGVDWWSNAIFCKIFKNCMNMNPLELLKVTPNNKQYSEEEIKLFKSTLAEEIVEHMQDNNNCNIEVDFLPCHLLTLAGDKIGISHMIGYPWKTYMMISTKGVYVSDGDGYRTLWTGR